MDSHLRNWIARAGRALRSVLASYGIGYDSRDFLLEEMPSSGRCAEVGVDEGDFSRGILEINRPAELHLVDPWEYHEDGGYVDARYGGDRGGSQERMDEVYRAVRKRFARDIAAGWVHVHRMTSDAAAAIFPSVYFDGVYIDGNHLYEYVKRDLVQYFSNTKTGRYLTGDDYGVKGWWDDGVTRAVGEFVERAGVEPVMFRENQFVLRWC